MRAIALQQTAASPPLAKKVSKPPAKLGTLVSEGCVKMMVNMLVKMLVKNMSENDSECVDGNA